MPELSDDLERRLSALATGPVVLPGAAAARQRGASRTRRTRAALAGGGAAALAVAVVLGGAVLEDGGRDRVRIPATAPAPAPGGGIAGEGLFGRLLTQDDVAQVVPGQWAFSLQTDVAPEVPVLPCGAGPAPNAVGDGRVTTGVQLSLVQAPAGTVVRQAVEEHSGPTTAARSYDLVRERVEACPEQSLPDADGPGTVVTEVVDEQDEGGVRTLLVRALSTCGGCPPQEAWFAVQQAGDVLSALRVDGVDGGVEAVEPFAELVAERLRGPA